MELENLSINIAATQQGNLALLHEWLKVHAAEEAAVLTEFLYRCQKDIRQLYRIYESLWKQENEVCAVDEGYEFHVSPERIWLCARGEEVAHTAQEWKRIIGKGISFLEELLPLGSVVELQKEFLEEKMPSLKDAGKAVLVITERYLSLTGHSYFPYAGVPYPTGTFDGTSRMLFSPALIKEVLHTGYQEKQEQAYQYRMKREYLLEKDMDMCGFETAEERKEIQRIMEEQHGR